MSLAPITEAQWKCVKDDINMDDVKLENKVKQVREWMKKQPHLPQVPEGFAEKMIYFTLVSTKLSTEITKHKIDAYYAMRHQLPEVFSNRDPCQQDIRDSVDKVRYFPISKLTPDGFRITIFSYNSDKDKKATSKDITATYTRTMCIYDALIQQGEFCRGSYAVVDCRGFYKSYLTEIPLSLSQKFTRLTQECLPYRLKGIFVIHASNYIETLFNLLRTAFKEKIRKRIHIFQGDHTNLYEFMPKDLLPSDFGGNEPSIEQQSRAWQKTIESMRDFFIEDTKRKTDESKRPPDCPNTCGQMLGVDGTFNKLNID